MSGHNKWSQIKEKKGKEDAKKSKLFSILVKTITIEARKAAGNKNAPNLRAAVEKAKTVNMPSDNIERAIERGFGALGGGLEEVVYEAYGPGGVAMIIEGLTDNKNRTTPEIRHFFSEHGGNLSAQGSVLWAFDKKENHWEAKTKVTLSPSDQNKLNDLLAVLEEHEDIKNIYTNICE